MIMKKHLIYIIGIATALFTACENIPEDERIIEVEGVTAQRVVLLEDYTGQACMNCPMAHEVATVLHEEYPENLIVVAIHSGMQGIPVANGGLKQPKGDEYAQRTGVEIYPSGCVNRRGGVRNYPEWTAAVLEELARPSNLDMIVRAEVKEGKLGVETTLTALENVAGKLQLWVIEDSIQKLQLQPDGKPDPQYMHNHVFRDAVNGTWGEAVVLSLGETKAIKHEEYTLDAGWKPENLSVVAFVYGDDGVLQAAQCQVNVME